MAFTNFFDALENLVTGIVSPAITGVYLHQGPVSPVFPICVVSHVSGVSSQLTTGQGPESRRIQFTVIATDAAIAWNLGQAMSSALAVIPFTGISWSTGRELSRVQIIDRLIRTPTRPGNLPLWVYSTDFMHMIEGY